MKLIDFSVSKYIAARVIVSLLVFGLSLLISPFATSGDQGRYILAYDSISNLSLSEGFYDYYSIIGNAEFIHYLITWTASSLNLDKFFIMSIFNAALAYFSMKLFEKWGASIFISVVIIFSNYYIIALYFMLERLKIGFIFLILSLLFFGINKKFYLLVIMAVLSHLQYIIIYASVGFSMLGKYIIKLFGGLTFSIKDIGAFLLMATLILFVIYLGMPKFEYYYLLADDNGIYGLLRMIIFFILSAWYSKNKLETIFIFTPLLLSVFLVGGDRVNILGYFIFLYYGLQYKRGLNFGVIATSVYFFVQSYFFILNIIEYGDGYYVAWRGLSTLE